MRVASTRHRPDARAQRQRVALAVAVVLGMGSGAHAQQGRQGPSVSPSAAKAGQSITVATSRLGPAGARQGAEVCFPVETIEINGLEVVDPEVVRSAVSPKATNCIGNASAKEIVAAINEAYSSRGFVTTQGYVPQQDIKGSKRFIVNVVTGRVGKIVYREEAADETFSAAVDRLKQSKGPWDFVKNVSGVVDTLDNWLDRFQLIPPETAGGLKAWLATPLDAGDALNLDRLQQGIDNLNKAASQKAAAKLEAGEAPGTSNIAITNPRQDAFRLSAGYEINGTSLNNTGNSTAKRLRFDLGKDNLIGINDQWSASYAGGIDSNEVRAAFALPVRWFLFAIDGGYSENLSALSKSAELFSQTYTGSASLSYLASRDKQQQTSFAGSLNWRHLERYINSAHLTPQTIAYARFGVSHQRFYDDRQLVLTFGISRGLKILDATRDPAERDFTTPRAQFFKLDGGASYAHAIKGWGVFKADLTSQWTALPLYSDDQLTLGSISTVRGFARHPFKADRGVILRSEFASAVPVDLLLGRAKEDLTLLSEMLGGTQGFVFADFGHGRDLANRRDVSRGSIGGGLRYRHGRLTADMTIAKPVYQMGLAKDRDTLKPEFYLTVSSKLF